jgi:C4-dicarboxylate-specific signal transduction histidine kinase
MSLIERVLETREPRYEFEYRIVRPDFTEATVRARAEISYSPDDGNPVRVLGTVQDVTEARAADYEVRRLRGQLYHADRVVRASALTASLAHELNQPLAAILSNAQAGLRLMARDEPDLAEVHAILGDIVRDDKRAAAVINGLRAMLRQRETDRGALDVEEALNELLMLLHGELVAADVELATEFEAGCVVYADKTQFEQVMLNLVLNAIEAMRDPAVLERRLAISTHATREGTVHVMICDSGPGIPADKTDTVFDAFWTTKEQGMGMGLAVCRNIVESQGGRIWLEPGLPGGGACFSVELPVPPDAAPDA